MQLRAENLSKQFYRKRQDSNYFFPVKEVSLVVEEGKITVLHGASGGGKSTLLNMLAGILEPEEGQVFLGEDNLYQMEDKDLAHYRNQHIGVIPQGQTAVQSLTVLENVLLPVTLYGVGKKNRQEVKEAREYGKILLDRMGIGDLEKILPSELSGGEMRRMAIARALIKNPDVVLADEPTADLDEENTRIVLEELKKAAKEGCGVLLVTHDRDAMGYADISYRMKDGEIQKEEE
ncbi:MAG: ABC transporter ATP-binding protein [Eubacterium sp.]|nr:ABC transporter ATP-binding protein [Eubacterium sp.]